MYLSVVGWWTNPSWTAVYHGYHFVAWSYKYGDWRSKECSFPMFKLCQYSFI